MGTFVSGGGVNPVTFQKAMAFIDGTNLFRRLEAARLSLRWSLSRIVGSYVSGRQVVRTYLYTIEPEFQRAKDRHGRFVSDDIRVVYGEGIPLKDGNVKEKGVDALLVADLVYHAAVKNLDYALVLSVDTDFVQALGRVEDFGCRTGVLAVCCDLPDRLRDCCDEPQVLTVDQMLRQGWAERMESD